MPSNQRLRISEQRRHALKRRFFPGNPACSARIACYTPCSRLPALVRRSEPQETRMSDFKYSITNLKPVEPVQKINITFPDGATREFPKNISGLDIAKGISPSGQAYRGDGAGWHDCRSDRRNRARCED